MGTAPKSISLTEQQVRAVEIELMRQALIEGEQGGEPQRFDFAAFKRRKSAQYG